MNDRQLQELYGRPCTTALYRRVEVWGQRVRAHQLVADHFVRTCQAADRALLAAGALDTRPQRVDSFACRPIRGQPTWSRHAFGLAWDIFRTAPGVEPPGGVWHPDLALHPVFVAVFEAAGFTWGGRWRREDQPHFEWNRRPPL